MERAGQRAQGSDKKKKRRKGKSCRVQWAGELMKFKREKKKLKEMWSGAGEEGMRGDECAENKKKKACANPFAAGGEV